MLSPGSTSASPAAVDTVLGARAVAKRYGGVRALRGASLHVRRGEVHGLLGENGSGKSTMLGILSGQVQADAGRLELDGEPVRFADPPAALAAGIAIVTQETTLVPELTVAENVLLGRRLVRGRVGIDWAASVARAQELLTGLGLDIDANAVVRELPPDQQQLVEIARATSMDARVLILDEPTSSLTDDEVEALFRIVRGLSAQGVATIFVSHRMREVFALVDRVTVLRDGETVGGGLIDAFDEASLIELMVGRELEPLAQRDADADGGAAVVAGAEPAGDALLRLRGLSVAGTVHDVDLDVAAGEIVGLAGLVGAGRSELLGALFGLGERTGGAVRLDGRDVTTASPRDAMRAGIAYVPADRKQLGLAMDMSVLENLLMAGSAGGLRLRRPQRADERDRSRALIDELGIVADAHQPVRTLSGGNQQKVMLGKWFTTEPRVLLMDEPTRGVDVGAKADIYRILEGARARGLAVLVSSSEVPELLALCDRVAVMFRGRVVAALSRAEASEARIAHYATGGR